ncbi:hypothetical protein SAMN04489806_3078 [Paramicrobacterium humi]|uniref:Histone deacetylase n=1 Tax=Paramicrobacterium humi TaxID=640635 RepID=A0A1H4T1W8_9MICO|nr:histone deacetylase [Microbacterium humi]SEC50417.1 hypothetical protein SAMN04489806_3078 [Microbacterium humi]
MREVWYVSYGSNMCRDRLLCYLQGGTPTGATVCYPGARDRREPAHDVAVHLPGSLYFAGVSHVWGAGGMAFYDHDAPGPTPARAYRITVQQFADVAAQEMHRLPGQGNPIEEILVSGLPEGRHEAGLGHYETLLEVGERDGLPMYTFTAPFGMDDVAHTHPTEAYLMMLATGLREAHDWDLERIRDYLRARIAGTDAAERPATASALSAR